jgi:hypothetical protein
MAAEVFESGETGRESVAAPRPTIIDEILWLFSSAEGLSWVAIGFGVICRIWKYSLNRTLYKDEWLLLPNLTERALFDMSKLSEHQLAPPGFLVVERLMVRLPFPTIPTARFVPFLAAIVSLFVFRAVARRYLDRRAVPIAVWLFAFTDYLLYYASEIKQYSTDVLLTLVAFWLAARMSGPGVSPKQRTLALGAFGAIGVWFSHPLVMTLAGIGTYLVVEPALRRRWSEVLAAGVVGVAWIASFGVCFKLSQHLLEDQDDFMWVWWNFAFLPIPPRSLADADRVFWHIVNVFVHPTGVLTPLGFTFSALLGLGLFAIGCVSLGRRWPVGLWLVLAPVLFTLAASAVNKYPFHGRLILFLIPTIQLLVAEGLAALGRPIGWPGTLALATFLLVTPICDAAWQFLVVPRERPFDSHGDLWNDLLDEREYRTLKPRIPFPNHRRYPPAPAAGTSR